MSVPEWAEMDDSGLQEYVTSLKRRFDLTDFQSKSLLNNLRWKQSLFRPVIGPVKPQAELDDLMYGIAFEQRHIGDGLTGKTVTITRRTGQAAALLRKERSRIRHGKRKLARKPFSRKLCRDTEYKLEDALWAKGCLQFGDGEWFVPEAEYEPYAGVWWYRQEILRLQYNATKQSAAGEPEYAAYHAFKAGELFAELQIRLAYNDFYAKQVSVRQAQRDAPAARRKQTDEMRRERVRYYLELGDKPTIAGENAANDLGISLSTIRRAFPGNRIPESANAF